MTYVSSPFLLNHCLYAFGFQIHHFKVFFLYVCRGEMLLCCPLQSQVEAAEMEPLHVGARVRQAGDIGHQ